MFIRRRQGELEFSRSIEQGVAIATTRIEGRHRADSAATSDPANPASSGIMAP